MPDLPKKDYFFPEVRSFYIVVNDRKSNDDEVKAACKLELVVLNTYQN